ncbi:MAG: cellulose synthase [Devosia sp.]|uniref:cellulose synthase n=1 Tax=Devosia sp. TaxID=1871048 RepID=UPI0024C8ED92|nr:cellulose synthase [Devosia sp.]UYN99167.1 MAG: cellulose synthase [Devosia sp.]
MKVLYIALPLLLIGGASFTLTTAQFGPASAQAKVEPFRLMAQAPLDVQTTIEPASEAPAGNTTPPAAAPAATAQAGSSEVDETALRYFARQGDLERMQREIDRLRILHPGWQPPADPLAEDVSPNQDIITIWELFSAGDYAGTRAAIAALQEKDPNYQPSADLLQSLALGEATQRLRNASDAGEYEAVISVAANNPQLLICESVDNLWRVAEAFARTGAAARASDAYRYVLDNCENGPERLATVQKASELLDRTALDALLALERQDAAGLGEFASIRLDLARSAVAASLEEGDEQPLATDLARLETEAEAAGNAEDFRLLGYYELDQSRPNEARRMFERAMAADSSAASAEGLGVTLLQLRDPRAAEAAIADYRADTETLAELYLDVAAAVLSVEGRPDVGQTVLGRIVDAAMSARSANVAQELGWYAYEYQQPQTAFEWFTLSLGWQADLEPAAYGLMVSANALGNSATVESIRAQWGGRSARIAQFGQANATSAAPATSASGALPLPRPRPVRPGDTSRAPPASEFRKPAQASVAQAAPSSGSGGSASSGGRSCQNYVPATSLSPGGALNHAWCLMGLNRPAQAVDHFARALQSSSERTRSDAAYGQSLAFIRLGLGDEAAVAAAAAPLSQARIVELEIAILTQKATSAYGIGDYARAIDLLNHRARFAPERNDLLTLRAWSYYHLRRFAEAERIFEAVAATGYGDAVSGLEASRSALAIRASTQ